MRSRITFAIVALAAVVLALLAVLLYTGVRRAAWQQHDDGLAARARAIATIAERETDGYEMELPPQPGAYLEVWRPDGSILARSPRADLTETTGFFDLTLPDGRSGRGFGLQFQPRDELGRPPTELALVLAEGTEDVDAAVATVRTWFVVLGVAALAAIAALTSWSLRRGLAPLDALANDLEQIDDAHLATRLPVAGQPPELVAPVGKLNELLGRLDASFARERRFTADVSHELRTPLAGLRTLLEVTQLAERSPDDYKTAIAEARGIAIQLGTLVENLLMLARLDAGQIAPVVEEVALRGLVDECWKPHAALAASRQVELRNRIADGAIARTDREKLRIVLGNLLSNAAEYTAAGGWIEIATGDGALVDVTDSGPPLPDDEAVFDRMWRGDLARAATGVHCGIGLPLARSLCTCLGKTLTATTRPDGSVRFRVA